MAWATKDALTVERLNGVVTSYTPTWAALSSAPTLGNATLTGRYTRVGKRVDFEIAFAFGSTSSGGTGGWTFTLPSTPTMFGSCVVHIVDVSTAAYIGIGVTLGTNLVAVVCEGLAASYISTSNKFTWTTSDNLTLRGHYFE